MSRDDDEWHTPDEIYDAMSEAGPLGGGTGSRRVVQGVAADTPTETAKLIELLLVWFPTQGPWLAKKTWRDWPHAVVHLPGVPRKGDGLRHQAQGGSVTAVIWEPGELPVVLIEPETTYR